MDDDDYLKKISSVFMDFGIRGLLILIMAAVIVWPYCRVLSRLGFSPWLGVLVFVRIVNIIALWLFAYAKWPPRVELAAMIGHRPLGSAGAGAAAEGELLRSDCRRTVRRGRVASCGAPGVIEHRLEDADSSRVCVSG